MFSFSIKDLVRLHHIINNITLGDFFGAKLFWSGEVLSIVVSKMVVADNRDGLERAILRESHIMYWSNTS